MAYIYYNPNPLGKSVGDCVVRALSKLLDESWIDIYTELCFRGALAADMPSSNAVWSAYLKSLGYSKHSIPDTCPDCYTIRDFCDEYPEGTFLVAIGDHVVTVVNGDYYDAWDSGSEIPISYYCRREVIYERNR